VGDGRGESMKAKVPVIRAKRVFSERTLKTLTLSARIQRLAPERLCTRCDGPMTAQLSDRAFSTH
jgi:hypothetical protein